RILGYFLVASFFAIVEWVIFRDWTLPRHPVDPRRVTSLTIYDGPARDFPDRAPDLDQCLHVKFEAEALKTTVHAAILESGGLPMQYPTWLAIAKLDDGTEKRLRISHVGVFEVAGQRGVYKLPNKP